MLAAVTVERPSDCKSLVWYFDLPEQVAAAAVAVHLHGAGRSDFREVEAVPADDYITLAIAEQRLQPGVVPCCGISN